MGEIQRVVRLSLAAAVLGLGLTVAGGAQAEDVFSANVTMTTDYLFRGISQTGERPAIQGGFDYAHTSGLYLGTWASNVNYGSDTSTEIDYYVGFAGELAAGVGYDFSFIYFNYPGDESSFDYWELAASFNYSYFTAGLNYADEYFGDGGPKFYYPYLNASFPLNETFSLDLHYGYTFIDVSDYWTDGEDDYADYSLGVSTSWGGLDFSLNYVGTTISGLDAADNRLVFAISKSF